MPFETTLLRMSASTWEPEIREQEVRREEKLRDHHGGLQLSTRVAPRRYIYAGRKQVKLYTLLKSPFPPMSQLG